MSVCVQQLDPPQQEQLNAALNSVAQQLRRLADVPWLCSVIDPSDHEVNPDSLGPAGPYGPAGPDIISNDTAGLLLRC